MASDFAFTPWKRSSLLRLAANERLEGRLKGNLRLKLTETRSTGAPASGTADAPFLFLGPRDVAEIDARAILRTAPVSFDHDAEATKLAHVDFREVDFLWRYSPTVPEAGDLRLRPWLVLLVGTADELEVKGGSATVLSNTFFDAHDLTAPWAWAHVQSAAGREHCRLLSARKKPLPAMSACVAVVVPAFDKGYDGPGEDFWSKKPTKARALYSWTFWTAEAGDFETLAGDLRVRDGGDLGRVSARYSLPGQAEPVAFTVFGAIKPLGALPMGQVQPPQFDAVKNDLAARVAELPDAGPRPQIGLPLYGRPWVDRPKDLDWGAQLFNDPRFRGSAGVGMAMGIVAQETLLAAAIAQAGALAVARRRVSNLALGLFAHQALWRRLSDDPNARLWVLAPAMARLAAVRDGLPAGTVLADVTSADSPLAPALFSTAARRLLRPRGSVSRFVRTAAGAGVVKRSDLLGAANRCRDPFVGEPQGLPDAAALAADLGLPPLVDLYRVKLFPPELLEFLNNFVGRRLNPASVAAKVTDFLQNLLGTPPVDPATLPNELKAAWAPHANRLATEEILLPPLARFFQSPNQDVPAETVGFVRPDGPPRPDPCRPRDLGALGGGLVQALDPRQVVDRVGDTIFGIDVRATLAPPQLPIVLEYPTWVLLKDFAKDWLLPGVNTLPTDCVTAASSNPEFIDAYLIGLNTQFKNELHWRKLADDPAATTFTLFWGTVRGAGLLAKRTPDVRRFPEWTSTPLGDVQHQFVEPGDPQGKRDLVIVFRTTLFRRYPGTQVYLRKIPPPAQEEAALKAAPHFGAAAADDRGPIFQGSVTDDVVFFIFDLSPDDLKLYWVMLEEPPAELRFRVPFSADNPDPQSKTPDTATSAAFAARALDHPTRVAISWASMGGA